jgi:hypothetical protein
VYPNPAPKTWYLDDVQISGELAAGAPGPGAGLTLEPQSATALVGESHTATATVPSAVGAAGTAVTFEVYRQSVADPPETGTVRQLVETTVVTSDESATATHSYSAAEAGEDWIVACVVPQGERCTTGDQDTGTDIEPRADIPAATATVTWQEPVPRDGTDREGRARSAEGVQRQQAVPGRVGQGPPAGQHPPERLLRNPDRHLEAPA